jgi:hypothetical protein
MCGEPSNVYIAVEIPAHWSDMKQQDLCVVQLHPGDPEYNTVARKFNETCSRCHIKKVSLLLTWRFQIQFQSVVTLLKSGFELLCN